MVRLIRLSVFAIALVVTAAGAHAVVLDEANFGDFSGNGNSPTTAQLLHGTHTISTTFGAGDFDMLAVTIPVDHHLDGITLLDYSGASQSFFGVQSGSKWTAGTGASVNPALLLGWTHFGPAATGADAGDELLDKMAVPSSGSAGFSIPLGPGVYTFLFQDTSTVVTHSMLFNVGFGNFIEPGDFNEDEVVDGLDLTQWKGDFGQNGFSDGDNDNDTDGNDLLFWQRNLEPDPLVGAVPEPATVVLAAMALAALIRRRPLAA